MLIVVWELQILRDKVKMDGWRKSSGLIVSDERCIHFQKLWTNHQLIRVQWWRDQETIFVSLPVTGYQGKTGGLTNSEQLE